MHKVHFPKGLLKKATRLFLRQSKPRFLNIAAAQINKDQTGGRVSTQFLDLTTVKLLDTTARDAHQSLVNSQGIDYQFGIKTAQLAGDVHLKSLANGGAGLRGFEAGGGMMPDACARTLGLNYWWWIYQVSEHLPDDIPLQILLRSQSANGYRPFADDIIEANIKAHVIAGDGHPIRGRVFDALNSVSNSISTYKAAQKHGMETEGMYCYNVNKDGSLDIKTAVAFIRDSIEMGADGIGIKDMAGLMTPEHAYLLGYEFRLAAGPKMNISCHTHMTSHMAPATYVMFIKGNMDAGGGPISIDGSISSFSGGPAQPALETLAMMLKPMDVLGPNLETKDFSEYAESVKGMVEHIQPMISKTASISADPRVMISKSPGGAYGNLVAQLEKASLTDLLPFILNRIPVVKEKLGNIPLVTPTALHVTTQAAKDVMSYHAEAIKNEFKVSSTEYENYINSKLESQITALTDDARSIAIGLYGQPPSAIDLDVKKLAIEENISAVINNEKLELKPDEKKQIINSLINFILLTEKKIIDGAISREVYLKIKKGHFSSDDLQFILRKTNGYDQIKTEINGKVSIQTLPLIFKQGLPVIGRSADILEPELDIVKESFKKAQKEFGFPSPYATKPQNALTATMFGGQETGFPGITSIGLKFFRDHSDPANFPNSAEMLRAQKNNKIEKSEETSKPTEVTKNFEESNKDNLVLCQMPGTFYLKPSPNEPSYVESGQWVDRGSVIGTTEAMKIFNKIEAHQSGYIKILANEGDTVDSDQALFEIVKNKEEVSS